MAEQKLDYQSTADAAHSFKWAATPALVVGCSALLADTLTMIRWFGQHYSLAVISLPLALVFPFIGIVLAALGKPNESARAGLGLAASGVSLVGAVLFIWPLAAYLAFR